MKIAIFDMDGTLLDSQKDLTDAINFVREKNHNLKPLSCSFVVDAINMHERNLSMLFYETKLYEESDRELFEVTYGALCIKNVYLYDGVMSMLKSLSNGGVKLSVATNAPSLFAKTMLAHLGVFEMFDFVVGADMVNAPKPAADMLEVILDGYGYSKEVDIAWMIGDNSKDILSASNAGIGAIFAQWGFKSSCEHTVCAKLPDDVVEILGV